METYEWEQISDSKVYREISIGADGTIIATEDRHWPGYSDAFYLHIYKGGQTWQECSTANNFTAYRLSVANKTHIYDVHWNKDIYKINNFNPDAGTFTYSHVPDPGASMAEISVGVDGTVWALDNYDKIYRKNADNSWTNIYGRLRQISVGSSDKIWGVNSGGYIYTWQNSRWVNISGGLKWISVAGDGTVWGVNSSNKIYRRNENSWELIEGKLFKQIEVGSSKLVVGLDPDGKIFKLKIDEPKGPYAGRFLGWRQESYGCKLKQVSIGSDGKIWGIREDGKALRRDGNRWYIPGKVVKNISVGNTSNVWGIQIDDGIRKRRPDQRGWYIVGGRLKCISVGNDGEIWGVNKNNCIYRRVGSGWTQISGRLKQISVGSKNHIWGVSPDNRIYRRDVENNTWINVDDGQAPFKWVSVGFDGTVWAIEADDDIFVRQNDKWVKVNGKLKQISVGSANNVMGVNSENNAYTLTIESGVNLYSIGCKKSGKMLAVAGGSADKGANVIQWGWDGTPSQKWKITSLDGQDKDYFKIENCISGKVLDVACSSTRDGGNIHVWDWNGSDAQKWRIIPVGEAEFKIVPKCSGKAIDVAGGSTSNGANILQWRWHGGDNQRWCLTPLQFVPPSSASGATACGADSGGGEGESSIFGTTLWTGLEGKCGKDICGLALACGAAAAGFALCGVVAAGAVACGADVAGIGVCGAAACAANVCGAAAGGLTACGTAACAGAACGADACGAAACGGAACGAAACGAAACGADACGIAAAGASASLVGACAIDVPLLEACAANTCAVNLCPADACAADACAVDVIPIVPGI